MGRADARGSRRSVPVTNQVSAYGAQTKMIAGVVMRSGFILDKWKVETEFYIKHL